jgi:DNA-binding MarR family transcriptional regulator
MTDVSGENESDRLRSQLQVTDLLALLTPVTFGAFSDAQSESAMSSFDAAVLLALLDGAGSCRDIAPLTGMTKTEISRSGARLAAQLLVTRAVDGGTVGLELTDRGAAVARCVSTASATEMASRVGGLPPDERAALAEALSVLRRSLGSPRETPAVAP